MRGEGGLASFLLKPTQRHEGHFSGSFVCEEVKKEAGSRRLNKRLFCCKYSVSILWRLGEVLEFVLAERAYLAPLRFCPGRDHSGRMRIEAALWCGGQEKDCSVTTCLGKSRKIMHWRFIFKEPTEETVFYKHLLCQRKLIPCECWSIEAFTDSHSHLSFFPCKLSDLVYIGTMRKGPGDVEDFQVVFAPK